MGSAPDDRFLIDRETASLPGSRPARPRRLTVALALVLAAVSGVVAVRLVTGRAEGAPGRHDHDHHHGDHAEHVGTDSTPAGPRVAPRPAEPPRPPAVEPWATLAAGARTRVELELIAEHFPAGTSYKPGKPYALSREPPPGVRRGPAAADPVFYGEIPLPRAPVLFAITCPPAPKQRAKVWVDRDRDGILGDDDDPPGYDGTGTSLTAASVDLLLARPGGAQHRFRIWLWTSLEGGPPPGTAGFNFYTTCYRASQLVLPTTPPRHVHVRVPDPGNDGEFDAKRVWIDWNADRKAQDIEWLAPGEARRSHGIVVTLEAVEPFATAVTLRVDAAGSGAPDVEEALAAEPLPGNVPPPLEARDLDGRPVDLAEYRGKVVLVDFWATWCGPCREELPAVRAAYERFRARGFEVVGVSLDKSPAALREFLAREGVSWRQACDGLGFESPAAKRWKVRSIPATFLVGRDGRIAATDLRGEALERAVERALGAK